MDKQATALTPPENAAPRQEPAFAPVERHFRVVADCTADWESWHDAQGGLVWVNPAVERLTGTSVAECLAMPDYPLPLVASEDRPEVQRVLRSAALGSSGSNLEFRARVRDGGFGWMSLSWQPMDVGSDTPLGFRTSIRDVTERRRLREQLRLYAEHLEQLVQERTERLRQLEGRQRQMEKLAALGQLAAGVAHEINNPLAGMRNAFELIRSSTPPDHEHFELLGLIDREIDRISTITHQMYQLYSRPRQHPADFSLGRVIQEVVRLLESVARRANARIVFDAGRETPRVCLVEGEVKQILYNLVRNAVQATPPGGIVTIGLREGGDEVAIEVRDNGPGIPSENLPRIFEPFFTTKGVEGGSPGMGMGLSVSRSLIEAMGGRIEVTSAPGEGSLFVAILPLRIEQIEEISG